MRRVCAGNLTALIPPSLRFGATGRVHPWLNQLFQPRILAQLFDQFFDLLRLAFVRELR
jgi:hypothetical protein